MALSLAACVNILHLNQFQTQRSIYQRVASLYEDGASGDYDDWPLFAASRTFYLSCLAEDANEKNGFHDWRADVERRMQVFPMGRIFWRMTKFDPTKMVMISVMVS